jgi:PAS domain S-box-containing protein
MRVLYVATDLRDADILRQEVRRVESSLTLDICAGLSELRARPDQPSSYDVLLMDCGLSEPEQLQLIHYVRVRQLGMPVVAVSPANGPVPTAALSAGVDDYLVRGPKFADRLGPALRLSAERYRTVATTLRENEKLKRSEARLRLIIEALPTGVVLLDQAGKVLAMNMAGVQQFGISGPQDIVGRSFTTLMPMEDHPALQDFLAKAIGGEEASVQFSSTRDEGGRTFNLRGLCIQRDTAGQSSLLGVLERVNGTASLQPAWSPDFDLDVATLTSSSALPAAPLDDHATEELQARVHELEARGQAADDRISDMEAELLRLRTALEQAQLREAAAAEQLKRAHEEASQLVVESGSLRQALWDEQEQRTTAEEHARKAEDATRDATRKAEEHSRAVEEQAREQAREQIRQAEERARHAEERTRQVEAQVRSAEEHRHALEEQKRALEDQRHAFEEQRRILEEQRIAAEAHLRGVEEQRHAAEEGKRIVDEQRRAAEDERRASDERRRQAEEQAQAAEERARQAEEALRKAEEQARLNEEQARLAHEQLRGAEEQARQVAETLRLAEEQAHLNHEQAQLAHQERRAAQEYARQVEARAQSAEEQMQQADARAQGAEEQWRQADARAHGAEEQMRHADARVQSVEEQLREAEARVQGAEEQWRQAEARAQSAEEQARHAAEQAQQLADQAQHLTMQAQHGESLHAQHDETLAATVMELQQARAELAALGDALAQQRTANEQMQTLLHRREAHVAELEVRAQTRIADLEQEHRLAVERLQELLDHAMKDSPSTGAPLARGSSAADATRRGYERVGRLAAAMSDDLLAAIQNARDTAHAVLEVAPLGSPGHEQAHRTLEAVERCNELARHLFRLSTRHAAHAGRVDLAQLVRQQEALLHHLAGPDVELQFDLALGLSSTELDAQDVTQVLTSLIVAARDALPLGGVIRVATAYQHRAHDASPDAARGAERPRPLMLGVTAKGYGIRPVSSATSEEVATRCGGTLTTVIEPNVSWTLIAMLPGGIADTLESHEDLTRSA